MVKRYSELIELDSFSERLEYLKLLDNNATSPRHMSIPFYKSKAWLTTRDLIIQRDLGFDLGVIGVYIPKDVYVHHINPINENDIVYGTSRLLDHENLITTSHLTHNLIHYGSESDQEEILVERKPGDTILW